MILVMAVVAGLSVAEMNININDNRYLASCNGTVPANVTIVGQDANGKNVYSDNFKTSLLGKDYDCVYYENPNWVGNHGKPSPIDSKGRRW